MNNYNQFFSKLKSWVFLLLIGLFSILFTDCTLERPPIRPKKNLSKDEPVYYDFIARKYSSRKEYEKAIFQYQKIIDKFLEYRSKYEKELAWAEYEIGFCYYRLGNNKKAIEHFERVISLYNYPSARILAQININKLKANQ